MGGGISVASVLRLCALRRFGSYAVPKENTLARAMKMEGRGWERHAGTPDSAFEPPLVAAEAAGHPAKKRKRGAKEEARRKRSLRNSVPGVFAERVGPAPAWPGVTAGHNAAFQLGHRQTPPERDAAALDPPIQRIVDIACGEHLARCARAARFEALLAKARAIRGRRVQPPPEPPPPPPLVDDDLLEMSDEEVVAELVRLGWKARAGCC